MHNQQKARFSIKMLSEAYNFFKELDQKSKEQIALDLKYATMSTNAQLFKKLVGTDIWEFRSKAGGKQYRLLAFWDKNTKSMVVATHGFIKKTQKTPLQEIKKAVKLMNQYYQQQKGE